MSTYKNNINIFLPPENPCTSLLRKKGRETHFDTNSELSQYRTEKQIMSSKTTINKLFNDICYLFITCFG